VVVPELGAIRGSYAPSREGAQQPVLRRIRTARTPCCLRHSPVVAT